MDNRHILFILGAGFSVSSGLPTYRGENGIYENTNKTPSDILNVDNLNESPDQIWSILNILYKKIQTSQPSEAYKILKKIVDKHKNSLIVTQNIDGLLYKAGIDPDQIIELHGNAQNMICQQCNKKYAVNLESLKCPECNKICRPDIILFGESISTDHVEKIIQFIKTGLHHVIIIGSTLQFDYLINIIDLAKEYNKDNLKNGVIHINPDFPENIIDRFTNHNETLIWRTAEDGLKRINEFLLFY